MIFLKFFLLLGGLLLICVGIRIIRNGFVSRLWPATNGVIKSSEVIVDKGHKGNIYKAKIVYEYSFEGQTYSNNTISFGEYWTHSQQRAQSFVTKYPQGKFLPIYYDSRNPKNSVLEPGFQPASMAVILLGIAFTATGIYIHLTK